MSADTVSMFEGVPEARLRVLRDVLAERERQDAKWGGPDHDDSHGWHLWIDLIVEHAGKAYSPNDEPEEAA